VPQEVDDLFATCLARGPESRPATVEAFLAQIDKVIAAIEDPEEDVEPLARHLGLHPVAYPLLASDHERAAIVGAVAAAPDDAPVPAEPFWPSAEELPWPIEEDVAEPAASEEAVDAGDPAAAVGESPRRGRAGRLRGGAKANGAAANGPDGERTNGHHPAGPEERVPARLRTRTGAAYELQSPRMTVGRGASGGLEPDLDLRDLDVDKVVSREHAVFQLRDGTWHVSEVRARNGTWVNDEPLAPGVERPLATGDVVRVASLEFVFEATEPAAVVPNGRKRHMAG
jgi:hypothetical protein